MHTDTLIAQLREFFIELGLNSNLISTTADEVVMSVNKNDYTTRVQANVNTNVYSFVMTNGNVKSCGNFDDFARFFKTYLLINTEFIPNSMLVANYFMRKTGKSISYSNRFIGNMNDGYRFIYNLNGANGTEVHIYNSTGNTYNVDTLETDISTGNYTQLDSFSCKLVNGECSDNIVFDINSYITVINDRYGKSNDINIQRDEGTNQFNVIFSNENFVLSFTVEFPFNSDVEYYLSQYSTDGGNTIVEKQALYKLDDPYSMEELLAKVKESIGNIEFGSDDNTSNESEVNNLSSIDEVLQEKDNMNLSSVSDLVGKNNSNEITQVESNLEINEADSSATEVEEIKQVESTKNTESTIEDTKATETSLDIEGSTDAEISAVTNENTDITELNKVTTVDSNNFNESTENNIKVTEVQEDNMATEDLKLSGDEDFILEIVKENGNNTLVRFSYNDKILDMDYNKAKGMNVPVHKITKFVELFGSHGIKVTQEEIDRRIFSVNITENDELCENVVEGIYN